MKASELRINNWVYGIDEDFNRLPIKIGVGDLCDIECSIDNEGDYEPIPLTSEWIEKFGFGFTGYTYDKGELSINYKSADRPKGRTYYNSWAISEKRPEYVHQLQNLYFALTGEELTIKEAQNERN